MKFCGLCQDRGLIVQGNVAVPCECMRWKVIEQHFEQSGLPPAMRSCTFENFNFKYYSRQSIDPEKGTTYYDTACLTFKAAKDFVASVHKEPHLDGLLFTGSVGSGKTFLACCIANALLQTGYVVLFLVVPDLLDRIRFTYAKSGYTEQELLDAAREVPLLILDDLGAHNYTSWACDKLYSILNYRLNHCLPTIITTNINLEDLEEYLGERTTSRVYQMCRPYRLLVDVDIRVRQRQERCG